jgi:hypothetical protein
VPSGRGDELGQPLHGERNADESIELLKDLALHGVEVERVDVGHGRDFRCGRACVELLNNLNQSSVKHFSISNDYLSIINIYFYETFSTLTQNI